MKKHVSGSRIGKKLMWSGLISSSLIAIILLIDTTIVGQRVEQIASTEAQNLAQQDQKHIVDGVVSLLATYQTGLEKKIQTDLNVAHDLLEREGGMRLGQETVTWEALDQFNKETMNLQLPVMQIGPHRIWPNAKTDRRSPFVDEIQELTGETCTLFQRMNDRGDMIRVSTNVINKKGQRAIGSYIPTVEPDGSANDVLATVLEGQEFIGRSFVVDQWYITAYKPIFDSQNTVIGMLYVGVPAEIGTDLRHQIMNIRIGESGYVAVMDSQGTYAISPGGKMDGQNVWDYRDADGNHFVREIIRQGQELGDGESQRIEYPWKDARSGEIRPKVATLGYFALWDWVIVAGTWAEELDQAVIKIEQTYRKGQIQAIVAMLILLPLIALLWYLISRSITRPLSLSVAMLQDIAEGEGDLTKRVRVNSNDEIGQMAKYVNATLEKITDLVRAIRQHSSTLTETGRALSQDMNTTSASVRDIHDQITGIGERTQAQNSSVNETNAAMNSIKGTIANLNNHILNQTSSVTESSAAVEQMLSNISSVSTNLAKNQENVQDLTQASEESREAMEAMTSQIQEIAKESEGLLEVITVIDSIAGQTNLLSMNAAIEAAHAGDAGRGFAVVADEIRKLAESSSHQSKAISASLRTIQEAMGFMAESAEQVKTQFDSIGEKVETVSNRERAIKDAMDEQAAGSQQVLEAVGSLNRITMDVRDGSEEMGHGAKNVLQESASLGKISDEVSQRVVLIGEEIQKIDGAIAAVNQLSDYNESVIELLANEVAKFRIDEENV